MYALFFEMRPKPGHLDRYFEHVARLRPALAQHDGLTFLERYGSITEPDVLLSHQLWQSEEAILGWRANSEHRRSQAAGRKVHFADYRIRVGRRVLRRKPGGDDAERWGDASATSRCVLALYGAQPVVDTGFSAFESFTRNGRYISIGAFDSVEVAADELACRGDPAAVDEVAVYAIDRDYGRFDREEAPS